MRRAIVILAFIFTISAFWILTRLALTPSMALLYGDLDPSQAGEIISELDRQNVQYQIRGGAIFVDQSRRDELRLLLATAGLPANSGSGYELLDRLSGFSTTSQMFDAAYWRAKEGELARTMAASPFIASARVHIASAGSNPFVSNGTHSASVFVTPTGHGLSETNARALRFLVASAVAGLTAPAVSIIDATTGQLIESDNEFVRTGADADRAHAIEEDVLSLLEAFVGPGNVRVKANIETVTESQSITERRIDPDSRVAISADTQELTRSESGPAGGAVTVASNVPDGDGAGGAGENQSQESEVRERTNFEISQTQTEIIRGPGATKRLTVAVLVNGILASDESGADGWRPRSPEELEDLRELVQSAVGFREDRGDQVTIKSMPFVVSDSLETALPANGRTLSNLDLTSLMKFAVAAVVALILGLFVLRPAVMTRPVSGQLADLSGAGNTPEPEDPELPSIPISSGEGFGGAEDALPALAPIGDFGQPMAIVEDYGLDDEFSDGGGAQVERLKKKIEARQPDTVEILRNWLETDDPHPEQA